MEGGGVWEEGGIGEEGVDLRLDLKTGLMHLKIVMDAIWG